MTIPIDELVESVTPDEATDSLLDAADAVGLVTTSWQPLDPSRSILATVGRKLSDWSIVVVEAIKGGFREYATGKWQTVLAKNVYDVDRIEETFASAEDGITLTNASATDYGTINAGDVVVENSSTGKQYRNTSSGNLGPSSSLTLDVQAVEAGSASNALAGDIDTMVTALVGVTVTNAVAVLGNDAEADDDLDERMGESLGALSPNGPEDAYSYIAKSTVRDDGSTIEINRVRTVADDTQGNVTCTIAGPSGAPTAADVSDVGDAIAESVVPIGITPTTQGATNNTIAVTYTAYVPATTNYTDTQIKESVEAELARWFAAIPIGGQRKTAGGQGYVYRDLLRARISDSNADIFTVDLSVPAADVAIADTEVPVLGAVSGTVIKVVQT